MQLLIYILVYPILWIVSMLPFRLLYLISDGVYLLLYHIIGYRKKVVTENLKLVFPDKSDAEIFRIRKKFYKHLCDMFLEMIKTMTISKASLKKRFVFKNPEEFRRLETLNKSIIIMYGHYASWEWSMEIQNHVTYKGYAVYKKLANKYFDKLVRDNRSRFKTHLINTRETTSIINHNEAKGIKSGIAFISDQSPSKTSDVYWGRFMGIEVPCFTGAERLAKRLDLNITYLKITKVKRGHYEAELITLAENARDFKDYDLTDMFLREVEKQIYNAPEFYFWTHKRWKHFGKRG
jgi:KDO2-lipid IV(A) lauroyltransferase